jgi:uncharacterized protein (TIGR01777 family)
MARNKIVIAGGTGFLGQSVIQRYKNSGAEIVVLTRGKSRIESDISYVNWDAESWGAWTKALEESMAVINLVGRSVNCRYTQKNKQVIINSRVNATRIIGKAVQRALKPPLVWINAGSVAIFGNSGDEWKDEASDAGGGFSPEVCRKWEAAFYESETPRTRKVLLRLGVVLQKDRGLLKPFNRLTRLGLAGKIGTGEQYISWIHEDDFTHLIQSAIEHEDFRGTIHGVSPFPVKNKFFLKALRDTHKIPFGLPHPSLLLKLTAPLIGTEAELLLSGRRVISKVLSEKQFRFAYPEIKDALAHLII